MPIWNKKKNDLTDQPKKTDTKALLVNSSQEARAKNDLPSNGHVITLPNWTKRKDDFAELGKKMEYYDMKVILANLSQEIRTKNESPSIGHAVDTIDASLKERIPPFTKRAYSKGICHFIPLSCDRYGDLDSMSFGEFTNEKTFTFESYIEPETLFLLEILNNKVNQNKQLNKTMDAESVWKELSVVEPFLSCEESSKIIKNCTSISSFQYKNYSANMKIFEFNDEKNASDFLDLSEKMVNQENRKVTHQFMEGLHREKYRLTLSLFYTTNKVTQDVEYLAIGRWKFHNFVFSAQWTEQQIPTKHFGFLMLGTFIYNQKHLQVLPSNFENTPTYEEIKLQDKNVATKINIEKINFPKKFNELIPEVKVLNEQPSFGHVIDKLDNATKEKMRISIKNTYNNGLLHIIPTFLEALGNFDIQIAEFINEDRSKVDYFDKPNKTFLYELEYKNEFIQLCKNNNTPYQQIIDKNELWNNFAIPEPVFGYGFPPEFRDGCNYIMSVFYDKNMTWFRVIEFKDEKLANKFMEKNKEYWDSFSEGKSDWSFSISTFSNQEYQFVTHSLKIGNYDAFRWANGSRIFSLNYSENNFGNVKIGKNLGETFIEIYKKNKRYLK